MVKNAIDFKPFITSTNRHFVRFRFLVDSNDKIDLIKVVKIDHFLDFTDCWDALFKSDNNYVDEYGVIYSPDRKVLIQWHDLTTKNESFPISYVVQDGTEIICNEAFMYCKDLETISLPASLKIIGENVFEQTKVSNILNNSPAFEVIEDVLYSKNHEIIYYYSYNKKGVCYKVPNCVKKIVKGCFSSSLYLWIIQLNHIYYDFDDFAFSNKAISIPIGTRKYLNLGALYYSGDQYRDYFIRPNIFEGELTIIDGGVVYSADRSILYRFPYWLNQEEYRVDPKCRIIEYAAFDDSWGIDSYGQHIRFNKLKQLYLSNGLQEINDYAFVGCGHIENVTIPQSVKRIGNFVFGQCVNLMTLTFLSHIDNINEKAFHVGKTMPGSLVNPDVPYVSLQWKKNEVDIVICPRGTDNYYKRILNNMNSQVCVLSEDEEQIKIENPDHINDVNYFGLSPNQINLITSPLLKEKLKEIVYEIPQNESCSDFGLHLNKLKEILNQTVFDISKSTTRFYFRDALFGFCYMTKHYRARLVMGDCLYRSMDDAIDMLCRIYHDAKGEENCNDDLPF